MRNKASAADRPEAEKHGLKPKLRFPEFRNVGEWEVKRLEDIAPLQRGFDLPSDQIKAGNIPVVYSNGIRSFHSVGMAKAPGLVTGRSGTIGKIHFIKEGDYWPHNTSLWVTSFKGNSPKFIYYLYKSIGTARFASGSGVPTLNRNYVHSFHTYLPSSISEQQKIADCLSSLGDRITTETQKLDTLKAHKKGLMQQLFPAEGETLPKLRFPEFRDAGEWKKMRFGKMVAKSFYGTSNPTSDTGKYPVLRMGNMSDGKIDFSNLAYIDLNDGEFKKLRLVRGDVLLNRTNSYDLVGKISLFDSEIECITASYIVVYRLDEARLYPAFCNSILNTCLYQTKIRDIATKAVSQANINPTTFRENVYIFLPNISEQEKIANCLSSLDELITTQTQKIDTLKTHKKGLMQQLFPSIEEVKR